MSSSFTARRAGLSIAGPSLVDDPPASVGGLMDRVMALASLARLKDPSLPPNLRAYRHVEAGDDAKDVPFRLMFTSDPRSQLPNGVEEDPRSVNFWEAVERVMPGFAHSAQQSLAIRALGKGRPLDVAMEEGFRQGVVSLKSHQISKADAENFYTNAINVPEDAFLAHPDLGNLAFQAEGKPNLETGMGRLIARYQDVCTQLRKPLEQTNAADRQRVVDNIKTLNGLQPADGGTFEENHQHGWVAYAIGHGGGDWTGFLLRQTDGDQPLVSPYAHYGRIAPIAMAAGVNDRTAALALLEAGVSPNVALREMPQMFAAPEQARLNRDHGSDFLPVTVFAALAGSPGVVAALLEHGADPAFATEKNNTALHAACARGFEAVARVLDQHRADFTFANTAGHVPDELIPSEPIFNAFHQWAQARFDAQNQPVAGVRPAPTLAQRVQETLSPEDDLESLWTTQVAARPAQQRRSKSNP